MIDTAVVAAYLGTMLIVGWRARRQDAESYWVARRRQSAGAVTVSLVATIFGASSTLGVVGLGYSRGLTAAWWTLVGALALVPFGLYVAARVRSLAVYTLPDILREAYGNSVAVPAALMISIAWCGIIAAQMVAGAILINALVDLPFSWALALVAAVFVLYTFWGGQLSVIRTDRWQLLLFLGGLLGCLVLLGLSSGGPELAPSDTLPPGHLRFPVSEGFGWYDLLVYYPLIVGLPYMVGPDVFSRVLCARDTAVARRAALQSALLVVPISFLLATVGVLVRARYPAIAPETALPTAVTELVPIGLAGLIVAGFLAAVMSSADTTLISASTILALNVFGARGGLSKDRQLQLTRRALLAVGLAAWAVANFERGIISALLLGYTVFVGGVVFPTLGSFFRDRLHITSGAALGGVIVGGATALLGEVGDGAILQSLLGQGCVGFLERALGPRYTGILPALLCIAVMAAVGLISRWQQQRWAGS